MDNREPSKLDHLQETEAGISNLSLNDSTQSLSTPRSLNLRKILRLFLDGPEDPLFLEMAEENLEESLIFLQKHLYNEIDELRELLKSPEEYEKALQEKQDYVDAMIQGLRTKITNARQAGGLQQPRIQSEMFDPTQLESRRNETERGQTERGQTARGQN